MNVNKKSIVIPNAAYVAAVKEQLDQGRTVIMSVKGSSMRLFLGRNRDSVQLKKTVATHLKEGDVVLAEVAPKVYVIHRIIRCHDNELTLMGDGNINQYEHCQRDQVIGVVTHFFRKGRSHPDLVTGWKWRIYSFFWTRMLPFRRIILAIDRRLPFEL